MARLVAGTDEVKIRLSRGEKIGGLHGDLTVPLSQVRDVEAVAGRCCPKPPRGNPGWSH